MLPVSTSVARTCQVVPSENSEVWSNQRREPPASDSSFTVTTSLRFASLSDPPRRMFNFAGLVVVPVSSHRRVP